MKELAQANNNEYHANRTHLSSSMLKLLLKDPQQFYREWVLGERNDEYKPAFVEGSLTHTLCLEPEKVGEYAVFPGARRAGAAFERFAQENQGKTIVTANQMERAHSYANACMSHLTARRLLTEGHAEHNMVAELMGTPVKGRADYINLDKGYIVDVKTTSRPNNIDLFKSTCVEYCYDLSAALYCAIAAQAFGKSFDFYWIVISKNELTCEVYKASSETLAVGTINYMTALSMFKQCSATGIWTHDKAIPEVTEETEYHIQEV